MDSKIAIYNTNYINVYSQRSITQGIGLFANMQIIRLYNYGPHVGAAHKHFPQAIADGDICTALIL